MSFKIAEATPSSAIATSGTQVFSYPAGTSAGSYANFGHALWSAGLQYLFEQDAGEFSVSFGASDFTVTYLGSTSIPANSRLSFQANIRGEDDGDPGDLAGMERMAFAPRVRIDLGSPDTADANGYVVSQDITAAGVFSVSVTATAALAAAALAGLADVPRNVVAAWTTTSVMTVTGTDEYGAAIVESSASGTSFTGVKAFKTVTDVSFSISVTSVTVGTGVVLGLPVYIEDASQILEELEDNVLLSRAPAVTRINFAYEELDLLAGTPKSLRCPVAGTIDSLGTMVGVAVGTGGTVIMKVNNTAVDGLSVVVANSAAAGDIDQDTPTAGHASTAVAVDDELEIIGEAAFATSGTLTGVLTLSSTPLQRMNGAGVMGVQTAPTALTGDVRGTYNPTTTPDGATAFSLLVELPDPTYKGVTQFAG